MHHGLVTQCPVIQASHSRHTTQRILLSEKYRFQRTTGVSQVLSPGRGEQIKGDFAAAAKIGEVNLEANSTVKLAGEPSKPSQLNQLTLNAQVEHGPLYEQLIMSASFQPVYDQCCILTKAGPGKDPSS